MEAAREFGDALRAARLHQGLTLKELAALIDVEHSRVWRIEKGRENPTIAMMTKLADALGHIYFSGLRPGRGGRRGPRR
jgi:transcriptional regulator with XRE-family HTH domain